MEKIHTYIRCRPHKDGTEAYEISVDYGTYETLRDGQLEKRRIRETHTVVGSREDAVKEAGRLEAAAMQNTPDSAGRKSHRISLAAWNKHFIAEGCANVEESTRQGYHDKLSALSNSVLGNVPISRLTKSTLQSFFNRLSSTPSQKTGKCLSSKTVRHIHSALHRSLEFAVLQGELKHNPSSGIILPQREHKEIGHYDAEELKVILNAADSEPDNTRLMIYLYACTGIRRGEGCGLRFKDVDWEHDAILISNNRVKAFNSTVCRKGPKSKQGYRTISIPDTLKKMIKKEKRMRKRECLPCVYVLANQRGRPFHPDTITHIWEDFLKRHPEIRRLNLHALRHSQMTLMLDLGVSPAVAAARLGDTVATAMCTYAHSSKKQEQAAAVTINQFLLNK